MNLLNTYYTTHKPYVYNLHLFSSQQIGKQMLLTIPFFHVRKLSIRKVEQLSESNTRNKWLRRNLNQDFSSC